MGKNVGRKAGRKERTSGTNERTNKRTERTERTERTNRTKERNEGRSEKIWFAQGKKGREREKDDEKGKRSE